MCSGRWGLVANGRSTLIAHRLQTAHAAQRIVVLDEGRVVEDGSHDELVESGGRYAELWAAFRLSGWRSSWFGTLRPSQ